MWEHRPKKLLDQVRDAIRLKHYFYRTEQAYVGWIKRYIYFHDVRHPSEIGDPEVEAFLTRLAVKENVAASTQNQAFSAVLFLYREVLHQDLGPVDTLRAKRPKRLPNVPTKDETLRLIGCLSGTHQLMAKLIYRSGVRLMECLRLRVKDLEFERRAVIVRNGKGAQDWVTVLRDSLPLLFQEHLRRVKALHEQDLAQGHGAVCLPDALARKYPNADRERGWQYGFPASSLSQDPPFRRHTPPPPAREQPTRKTVKEAARLAGIVKPVDPHTLCRCFATYLLEAHYDIRTVQELLGHKDVKTTMTCTHVLQLGAMIVRSPLD